MRIATHIIIATLLTIVASGPLVGGIHKSERKGDAVSRDAEALRSGARWTRQTRSTPQSLGVAAKRLFQNPSPRPLPEAGRGGNPVFEAAPRFGEGLGAGFRNSL
jgi:hypothetical protein